MSTAREAATTDEGLAEVVARRGRPGGSTASGERAFRTLYDRHAGSLMAYLATRVRRSDLEDLHQDIWRRTWEHLASSFKGGQFRAWLFRIAHNALIDNGRKHRPEALGHDQSVADHRHEPPEARLIEEERMTVLRRCLDRLEAVLASGLSALPARTFNQLLPHGSGHCSNLENDRGWTTFLADRQERRKTPCPPKSGRRPKESRGFGIAPPVIMDDLGTNSS